jgi:hypothetical protein
MAMFGEIIYGEFPKPKAPAERLGLFVWVGGLLAGITYSFSFSNTPISPQPKQKAPTFRLGLSALEIIRR